MKEAVGIKELSEELGIHVQSIRRLMRKGVIKVAPGSSRMKNLFNVAECKKIYGEYTKANIDKYYGGGHSEWSN